MGSTLTPSPPEGQKLTTINSGGTPYDWNSSMCLRSALRCIRASTPTCRRVESIIIHSKAVYRLDNLQSSYSFDDISSVWFRRHGSGDPTCTSRPPFSWATSLTPHSAGQLTLPLIQPGNRYGFRTQGSRGSLQEASAPLPPSSLRFAVYGLGFGVQGLGSGVLGLGFRVWGLGFRVQGLGCRA